MIRRWRRVSDQVVDAGSVVDILAGPHSGVGVGGDVEVGIVRAQAVDAVGTWWRSWLDSDADGLRYDAAIALVVEVPTVGAVGFDAEVTFVQEAMVRSAQQDEIAQRGFATVRPVFNMVTVDEAAIVTAREAAGLIAYE